MNMDEYGALEELAEAIALQAADEKKLAALGLRLKPGKNLADLFAAGKLAPNERINPDEGGVAIAVSKLKTIVEFVGTS